MVFDEFANPNQPWTVRFFQTVPAYWEEVLFFASRVHPQYSGPAPRSVAARRFPRREILRTRAASRLLAAGRSTAAMGILLRRPETAPLAKYAPLVVSGARLVHLWNAQMYEALEPALDHLGARLLVSFRGYDLLVRPHSDERWTATLRRLFGRARVLHCVSHDLASAAAALGAPEDKIWVIPTGLPRDELTPPAHREDRGEPVLLAIGRLTWEKSHVDAVKAVAALVRVGLACRLKIAGDGPDRGLVEYWARRLGVREKVELLGLQDRAGIKRLLESADVLVHPSLSEGLPATLVEAAAAGIPVVATRVGGIPEVVLDGRTGILVEPGDPEGLACAIASLVRNGALRRSMGAEARRWFEERFTLEREMREWREAYTWLAGTGIP